MRILALAFLLSTSGFIAQAQELQIGDSVFALGAEPILEQRVQKRLEALGYKDLQVIQDVVVVRAKDESDQAVALLVHRDTLLNVKMGDPDEEVSTTGSAASD